MRNTFVVIFLILVSFGLGFAIDKDELVKSIEGNSESKSELESVEQKTGDEIEVEYSEYKSPFGFSFSYDNTLKLENTSIVIPPGYRVSAVAAVRYVDEQHCGASGLPEYCRAFLENPAVAFGVLETPLEELKKVIMKDYVEFADPITLSGKTGIQYYAGVEGEGIVTIALPLSESKTLLIQYTFDELFDLVNSNPEIYSSKEQKTVVDTLLSTLKFK